MIILIVVRNKLTQQAASLCTILSMHLCLASQSADSPLTLQIRVNCKIPASGHLLSFPSMVCYSSSPCMGSQNLREESRSAYYNDMPANGPAQADMQIDDQTPRHYARCQKTKCKPPTPRIKRKKWLASCWMGFWHCGCGLRESANQSYRKAHMIRPRIALPTTKLRSGYSPWKSDDALFPSQQAVSLNYLVHLWDHGARGTYVL